ncbi:MAG: acetate kinase [Planctomycetes bacterium]|nr:acetate kinase [Planctomycetota bacterium]
MNILVLNSGSSSIKFQLFDMGAGERLLVKGLADKIGLEDSYLKSEGPDGAQNQRAATLPDHRAALQAIFEVLRSHGPTENVASDVGGVGHRVVHGGEKFGESVLIDDGVMGILRQLVELAPLHNPPSILGIEICREMLPGVPNVAVFDTALHQTMPPKAYLYGLPLDLYRQHGIRRYGFHGTSHAYVAKEAARHLGRPLEELKMITCHLGNGCSITAFERGRSIDTSMGFTPLEGLVMGTRSGDVDPAVPLFLVKDLGMSPDEVDDLLNKESGLKGLCGERDMRDIETRARQGGEAAQTAIAVFVYRVQKYIGAYTAALGGVDVIVFTAGIGENSAYIRGEVLRPFRYLGLRIDGAKNQEGQTVFSCPDSAVCVMTVRTNEELVIARDTCNLIPCKEDPTKRRTRSPAE